MPNDLVVSVGANIRDLERAMKASAEAAAKRADEIEREFNRINPGKLLGAEAFAGLIKGAAAGFAIDKITASFIEANREIASFGETARRVGLDLQKFQEYRLAAQGLGIEGKAFDSGLQGLAKALNDARREETGLSELLAANNLKLKDRNGEVISTNRALAVAADLVSRAATEMDKVEIAEKFGLPKELVPLLERGAEALVEMRQRAAESGAVIDSDMVQKAAEFDRAWNQAWASFTSSGKASLLTLGGMVQSLIQQALGLAQLPAQVLSGIGGVAGGANYAARTKEDLEDLRAEAKRTQEQIDGIVSRTHPSRASEFNPQLDKLKQDLQDLQNRIALSEERQPRQVENAPLPQPRPDGLGNAPRTDATVIPAKAKGGGSRGGTSDEEQAQARLDRYIESLVRQRAVMEAEIATVGKSNAERKAAVEIAKAQVDLDKLSASEKANYIAKLTQEVTANEAVRASKERLFQAQKDLNEAQKYFGNAAVDALEDLIVNGAKAEDVMKRLVASLAKAALQAALLGEGPLAGIFGSKGQNGSIGGLLGLLFKGFASGGYVSGPGSGRSDSIPARLSNGEYVVNARATKQNRALLDAINSGRLPAFADGGLVGRVPSIPAATASRGGEMKVVVNNTVSDQVQATAQRGDDGSLQIMIAAIKGEIAKDVVHGRGDIGLALRARQTNQHLRG